MLPRVCASAAGFVLSPILARRLRPAYVIAPRLVVSACGGALLARVDASSSKLMSLVLGFALFNLGAAPLVSAARQAFVGGMHAVAVVPLALFLATPCSS